MADETQTPPVEETIDSLTAKLQATQVENADLREQITALQKLVDAEAASHEQTKTQLSLSQAELSEVTTVAGEQHSTITSLTDQLEQLRANPETYATITVEGATYEVHTKGFQYKKVDYTLADLIKDKALQKELVAKGVGFLVAKTA